MIDTDRQVIAPEISIEDQIAWAQSLVDDERMPKRLRPMHRAVLVSLLNLRASGLTQAVLWIVIGVYIGMHL